MKVIGTTRHGSLLIEMTDSERRNLQSLLALNAEGVVESFNEIREVGREISDRLKEAIAQAAKEGSV